jgi:PAS domain-containing protein
MEAIEAVPQGFVIYDADDRIAVFNAKYRDRFTLAPDMIRVGVSFEELSRETLRRGLVKPAPADPEAWLQAHVAEFFDLTAQAAALPIDRKTRYAFVVDAREIGDAQNGELVVVEPLAGRASGAPRARDRRRPPVINVETGARATC